MFPLPREPGSVERSTGIYYQFGTFWFFFSLLKALVRDAIENDADEAVEEGWMLRAQSGCTVELNSADIPEIENRRLEVGLLGMKEWYVRVPDEIPCGLLYVDCDWGPCSFTYPEPTVFIGCGTLINAGWRLTAHRVWVTSWREVTAGIEDSFRLSNQHEVRFMCGSVGQHINSISWRDLPWVASSLTSAIARLLWRFSVCFASRHGLLKAEGFT